MFIKIFLLTLLTTYSFVNAHHTDKTDKYNNTLYESIINDLIALVLNNSNPEIIDSSNYTECITKPSENDSTSTLNFPDLLSLSGSALGDIGLEEECLFRNGSFFLLAYELNIAEMLKNQAKQHDFLNFTDTKKFNTGICVYKRCENFFKSFFFNNKKLSNFLTKNYYLVNYDIYGNLIDKDNVKTNGKTAFLSFFYISLAFFIIRVIFSVIKVIFISTFKIQEKKELLDASASTLKKEKEKEKEIEDKILSDYKNTNYLFNYSSPQTETNPSSLDSNIINKNRHIFHRLTNFFDLSYNIGYLSKIESRYYSDKGLEIFSFFKFIIMIFLIYNHIIYTSSAIPGNSFLEYEFYSSFFYGFVKISTFSPIAWVILESATSSYKLMHYIKKQMQKIGSNYFSFNSLCKFLLKLIPKVMLFIICYYMYYIYVFYLEHLTDKTSTRFQHFIQTLHGNRFCVKEPHYIYIPLYYNYNNYTKPGFVSCFRFVTISTNLFYCFLFVMLLLYVCYKIRSKIFDIIIAVIVLINMCLCKLSYSDTSIDNTSHVTVRLLGGNSYSQIITHLFINYYMIGLFLGLIFFYHGDIISSDSIMIGNNYYPFSFCWDIIALIDPLHFVIKLILLVLPIVLFLLFSQIYFFTRIREGTENFYIKNNGLFVFFYNYEKEIFALLFGIIIMMTMVITKNNLFSKKNYFTLFNRISFAFFCILNAFIYISNSLFSFKIELKNQSLIFFVIGMVFMTTILATVITILYELPLRIWIRKLSQYIENRDNWNKIKLKGDIKGDNKEDNKTKELLVEMKEGNLSGNLSESL